MMRYLVVSLSLACMAWICAGQRPPYIECETSEECGKGACCVIGMGRFTLPRCETFRDLGETCRPDGLPVNVSLEYPDKNRVNLIGVYRLFCPCFKGLTCERDTLDNDMPRCMDGFLENNLDSLDSEY